MTKLTVASDAELDQAFSILGASVGPRRGPNRRTKDQKEWYCVRRYLLTLAAHKMLSYPLSIMKSDPPDFIASDQVSGTYGIEITEATEQDWQRELTVTEADEGDDPAGANLISKDGFAGEQPEHNWCSAVIRAVANKVTSLRKSDYPVALCDVLVYVNSRRSVVACERRAIELLPAAAMPDVARWKACSRLGRVAILGNSHVIPDLLAGDLVLPITLHGGTGSEL